MCAPFSIAFLQFGRRDRPPVFGNHPRPATLAWQTRIALDDLHRLARRLAGAVEFLFTARLRVRVTALPLVVRFQMLPNFLKKRLLFRERPLLRRR
jgi:hypothetical protein